MPDERDITSILELLTGRLDAEGKPLGPRRELTRERIVAASTELLLEHGYRGMRVDDVAAAAEVTRPTLYAYFESKGHLLIAAMAEESWQQLAALAPLFDPARPSEDRLRDLVREGVTYIVTAPLHARLVLDRDPEVMSLLREHELARQVLDTNPDLDKARLFSGLVQDAFAGAFSTTEANEIASLLRALSHMSPNLLDEQARFGLSVERFADLLTELLIGGMRSRLETQRVKTDADR